MTVAHTTDQAPITPARLLVVEDDPNVRDFCVRLLRMNGYDVTSAENGQVALERLKERRYDLVLTDDRMPIMGRHPGVGSIFMAARQSFEAVRAVFKLGAFDYLIKPMTVDDLESTVRRALENQSLPKSGALRPIEFHSCFISHSTKDEEFAKRLYGRMRQEGLLVWFAPEDMKGGKKLHEQIGEAIQHHDRLLLILSEHSLQSEWVMTELYNARQVELKENRRKLFPIRLTDMNTIKAWECFDGDSGKDLAREVREYYIPDFTHWKDYDAFEREFAKLLNSLKAVDAPPVPRIEPQVKPDEVYMQEDYIKVLQVLARMEAKKMPMISPRDIATDLGEDEQYVSDILEVLEKQKGFVEKKAEWKGDDQRSFIVGTTPPGRMYLRELERADARSSSPSAQDTEGMLSKQAQQQHLRELIEGKTRRLRHLEKREAVQGVATDPKDRIEIEDLRREIGELEADLRRLGSV
jgi:CheY-like chemotaxis protein